VEQLHQRIPRADRTRAHVLGDVEIGCGGGVQGQCWGLTCAGATVSARLHGLTRPPCPAQGYDMVQHRSSDPYAEGGGQSVIVHQLYAAHTNNKKAFGLYV